MNNFYKELIITISNSYKNKEYDNFDFEIRENTSLEKSIINRIARYKDFEEKTPSLSQN